MVKDERDKMHATLRNVVLRFCNGSLDKGGLILKISESIDISEKNRS